MRCFSHRKIWWKCKTELHITLHNENLRRVMIRRLNCPEKINSKTDHVDVLFLSQLKTVENAFWVSILTVSYSRMFLFFAQLKKRLRWKKGKEQADLLIITSQQFSLKHWMRIFFFRKTSLLYHLFVKTLSLYHLLIL